ncbi:MAG: hypothetical protein ACFFCM_21060 [Promethearchaeota archaeon]
MLFKGKIQYSRNYNFAYFLIGVIFPLIAYILVGLLAFRRMDAFGIIIVHLITLIPFLIFTLLLIFVFKPFLIIHSFGFQIKKKFWLPFYKFIAWNDIKEIKLYQYLSTIPRKYYNYTSAIYEVIIVFLKNSQKPLKIPEIWIDEIHDAYEIMKDFVKPYYGSEFCKNHPENESTEQCSICGNYFCASCVEKDDYPTDEISPIISTCISCNFLNGFKKITILYSLTFIFPLINLIIWLLNISGVLGNPTIESFYDYFLNFYYYINPIGFIIDQIYDVFRRNFFPFLFTVYFIIFINPYAYSIYLKNLIRLRKMIKEKIVYNAILPVIFTVSTIIITLYYSILYLKIPYINFYVFLSITIVFSLVFFFWKKFVIFLYRQWSKY